MHAALGDPHRLAIVEQLTISDRSPSELARMLSIDSNLLAHHLAVLQDVELLERVASQGDHRRRYVRLVASALSDMNFDERRRPERLVFVCTENVARSQLASALWNQFGLSVRSSSGGTHPGKCIHPETLKAAKRRGLDLRDSRPRPVPATTRDDLVVTVCDKAHEWLSSRGEARHVHWSVADPVARNDPGAFDAAADCLAERIESLVVALRLRRPDQ